MAVVKVFMISLLLSGFIEPETLIKPFSFGLAFFYMLLIRSLKFSFESLFNHPFASEQLWANTYEQEVTNLQKYKF